METFKPGDVVTLKSGSQNLTVEYIEDRQAYCIYYNDGKLFTQRIAVEALELSKVGK